MPLGVLIVEDVEAMRELLRHVVDEVEGLKTLAVAGNTLEARQEISRRRPGLVLLDEILPGESALDLLDELKEDGIPVLLITGVENPTHILPEGVLGRLQKPDWKSTTRMQAHLKKVLENL